jgi:hypothetical protein
MTERRNEMMERSSVRTQVYRKSRTSMGKRKAASLFGTDGEDLLALDFDFDSQGRADVTALDDGAAHPDVARKVGSLQRIIERAAARVTDKGMAGASETVVAAEPVQVGDIFELARTVGSLAREGPITCGKSGRAGGQPDYRGGDIFTRKAIADEEVGRGPGFR